MDSLTDFLTTEGLVVVDFWAPWCRPCLQIAPLLERLSSDSEIPLGKVNVDDNPDLASEYGIRSIPTLVLFRDGQEVSRVAGADRVAIRAMFETE